MFYRSFGTSDLKVSALCLGATGFGWLLDQKNSFAILDHFREQGGNFIQCTTFLRRKAETVAPLSCPSEEHLGAWLMDRALPRQDMVLASKLVLDSAPVEPEALTEHFRASCEASLSRLRTDYLDLLLLEWNATLPPAELLLRALAPLVCSGKLRYVGASGFPAWRVFEANQQALENCLPRLESLQAPYSLLERRAFETEYASLCGSQRLSFLANAPLGASVLGAKLKRRAQRSSWLGDSRDLVLPGMVERLEAIARFRQLSPKQVELAWVLRDPRVCSAVVEAAHLREQPQLASHSSVSLSADEIEYLRRIETDFRIRAAPSQTERDHASVASEPDALQEASS